MKLDEARAYAPFKAVAQATRDLAQGLGGGGGHHGHTTTLLRTAEHKGHRIEVATSYEIQVDGRRLEAALNVDNYGRVTCHAVPNYVSMSAVDLVKRLIDAYPDSFVPHEEPGEHGHGHGAGR